MGKKWSELGEKLLGEKLKVSGALGYIVCAICEGSYNGWGFYDECLKENKLLKKSIDLGNGSDGATGSGVLESKEADNTDAIALSAIREKKDHLSRLVVKFAMDLFVGCNNRGLLEVHHGRVASAGLVSATIVMFHTWLKTAKK